MAMHSNARTVETSADPLIIAINAYIDGLAAYNATPDDLPDDVAEELSEKLVHAPFAVLANWRSPATSEETALAAIRLAAREFKEDDESAVAEAMYRVALSFWRPQGSGC